MKRVCWEDGKGWTERSGTEKERVGRKGERRKKRELKNVYDDTMRFMKNKLLNIKVCNFLHQNCITNKYDAVNILRKIYDTDSNIKCELIAYALDNIVELHEK